MWKPLLAQFTRHGFLLLVCDLLCQITWLGNYNIIDKSQASVTMEKAEHGGKIGHN